MVLRVAVCGCIGRLVASHTHAHTISPCHRAVLDMLWEKVMPDGCLVIIEKGHLDGAKIVQTARSHMLEKYPTPERQAEVLAARKHQHPLHEQRKVIAKNSATAIIPCGHDRPCPMARRKTKWGFCHFGEKVMQSSLPARSPWKLINTQQQLGDSIIEKFSYVVIQKGPQVCVRVLCIVGFNAEVLLFTLECCALC